MTERSERNWLTLDEAAIRYSPDVLLLCRGVVERTGLVAQNFAAALPQLREEIASNIPDKAYAQFLARRLDGQGAGMARLRTELPEQLDSRPLEAAFRGLSMCTAALRMHTPYVAEIFHGYTPVHHNPDWPRYFHEYEFTWFGYRTEPLIALGIEAAETEGRRFPLYVSLYLEAVRRRQVVETVALPPLPVLN